ncbi:DUF4113 domain-containing protein [Salmonella enterica]|nr:DUF4113 domain-containing protein [Salmonella enterica]
MHPLTSANRGNTQLSPAYTTRWNDLPVAMIR